MISLMMVDFYERYLFISVIFVVYLYSHYVESGSTNDNDANTRTRKQLEELEEANEEHREKELLKVYSSSKANQFLGYDKCMQRMKCPASRKEECSEECKAGNTEEEIEEHSELTRDESHHSLKNAPKKKFESTAADSKKRTSKNKHLSSNAQSKNKADL